MAVFPKLLLALCGQVWAAEFTLLRWQLSCKAGTDCAEGCATIHNAWADVCYNRVQSIGYGAYPENFMLKFNVTEKKYDMHAYTSKECEGSSAVSLSFSEGKKCDDNTKLVLIKKFNGEKLTPPEFFSNSECTQKVNGTLAFENYKFFPLMLDLATPCVQIDNSDKFRRTYCREGVLRKVKFNDNECQEIWHESSKEKEESDLVLTSQVGLCGSGGSKELYTRNCPPSGGPPADIYGKVPTAAPTKAPTPAPTSGGSGGTAAPTQPTAPTKTSKATMKIVCTVPDCPNATKMEKSAAVEKAFSDAGTTVLNANGAKGATVSTKSLNADCSKRRRLKEEEVEGREGREEGQADVRRLSPAVRLTAALEASTKEADFEKLQEAFIAFKDDPEKLKTAFSTALVNELNKISEFNGLAVTVEAVEEILIDGSPVTSGAGSQAAFLLLPWLLMVNLF